jgi:hypothetical protein
MWIRLPDHVNVLRAGALKLSRFPVPNPSTSNGIQWLEIPLIQMERMDGCLSEWVENKAYSLPDRLSALAQAFNGLAHLYANGIEGHGDLKPSNLLFTDKRRTQKMPPDAWLNSHPWIVKVADLGWADAWKDYGYTTKAHRPYLAPERIGEHPSVVPEKSDMFSMGMIAAELIQGRHPSPNLKKAESHEGRWLRQIAAASWDLGGIESQRLKNFVLRCIDAEPDRRPSAAEAVEAICLELKETSGLDLAPDLALWTKAASESYVPYISSVSDEIERLGRTRGLGAEQENKSLERLREILASMRPAGIYSLEDWVQAAVTILDFLARIAGGQTSEEAGRIRQQAREYLQTVLGNIHHRDLAAMATSLHSEDWVMPFERFSQLIGDLAEIAEIDFEQAFKGEWNLGQLTLAGFAHHMASRARQGQTVKRGVIEYLDIAIDLSLIEAVPYFFRALRKREILIFEGMGIHEGQAVSMKEIIADLEIASQLAPKWEEPRRELAKVRQQTK